MEKSVWVSSDETGPRSSVGGVDRVWGVVRARVDEGGGGVRREGEEVSRRMGWRK